MNIKTNFKTLRHDSWLMNDGRSVSCPGEADEQFAAGVGILVPVEVIEC
jgi:hypothetical protein